MRKGFTLVEISVVLIITALLAGGILIGRDMIYNAKIHKVGSEVNAIRVAAYTFKSKYGGIPGDLPNAYNFFGDICGANAIGTGGCNGNGDSKINATDDGRMDPPGYVGGENELYKMWVHLHYFGFGDRLTGEPASTAPFARVGINIPKSRAFAEMGYSVESYITTDQDYSDLSSNLLYLGADNPSTELSNWRYIPHNPVFTPRQALALDQKYDDGLANSGNASGNDGFGGFATYPCINENAAPTPDVYNTDLDEIVCSFFFDNVF